MPEKPIKASVFIPPALNSKLKRLADREQRKTGKRTSLSQTVVRLVESALAKQEEAA